MLANALIPLLAALALVPVTGGADVPLAAGSSSRVVRLLGAFLGERFAPDLKPDPNSATAVSLPDPPPC